MNRFWPGIALLSALFYFADASSQSGETSSLHEGSKLSYWAYDALDLPDLSAHPNAKSQSLSYVPVIIAVIDDAFRLSHKDLKDFIYINPLERDNNAIDDDGNGKADDTRGWDISDNDSNVNPPRGREEIYYHGTFIAGSIITILKKCYGEDASNMFKILPVKVLSDHDNVPFLKDGYKGIEYAIEQGADVICCAWNGGEAGEDERKIIEEARRAGILVIGSAGNYYSEKVDSPASLEGVLAVGGVDTISRKTPESNYGAEVDLVAPAKEIRAAHSLADNAYFYGGGTSGATGLVTGCAAILRAIDREATPGELYDALINTSKPVDHLNLSYSGKLGAGLPKMANAVRFMTNPKEQGNYFSKARPRGTIYFYGNEKSNTYVISPEGAFAGFTFTLPTGTGGRKRVSPKQVLSFYSGDSLFYQSPLKEAPPRIFIPGSNVRVDYSDSRLFGKSTETLSYVAMPIDSSSLYCSGTSHYSLESDRITDGSGEKDYANNSSCKWLITVGEGERINIRFSEFDTEAKVDFVYLFDGESAIPENIIAKFSGPNIPPEVTSRSNTVLVWFVTDARVTGNGWEMSYSAISLQ